jgi:hypothetical protein
MTRRERKRDFRGGSISEFFKDPQIAAIRDAWWTGQVLWRESEMALNFARTTKFRDVADIIVSQPRFVATMQGRTAALSTFTDVQFDEATFEAQLTGDRMSQMICLYWILKLKARFLSGDYAEALAAADKAKAMPWGAAAQIYLLDYSYYTALTLAAAP